MDPREQIIFFLFQGNLAFGGILFQPPCLVGDGGLD
jgi:hypothetical protein